MYSYFKFFIRYMSRHMQLPTLIWFPLFWKPTLYKIVYITIWFQKYAIKKVSSKNAKSRWSLVVDSSFFCSVGNQDLNKYLFRNPRENETFLRNALSRNFDHKEKLVSIIFCRTHRLPLQTWPKYPFKLFRSNFLPKNRREKKINNMQKMNHV